MRPTLPVLAWLTVGGLAVARPAPGQAALTPADSAILNSQPLKRLVLAPSLLRRLNLLAAGLDREVVLCLQGTVLHRNFRTDCGVCVTVAGMGTDSDCCLVSKRDNTLL